MNHWLALYCPADCVPSPVEEAAPAPADALALAQWALQFTPRVALLEEAVVLEVQASLRLFGGARALRRRLAPEARELGVQRLAWAPTSLAALACARALQPDGFAGPLHALLDPLPLQTISAAAEQEQVLARLGCRILGDVRALPRAGLSRRFGPALLDALDRAYGLLPESHAWVTLPDVFEARLELPGRVENAPELLFAAQRLLIRLGAWLTARHCGVTRFTLSWQHDFHRRAAGPGGELSLRTVHATRHVGHLRALLAEHLDRTLLAAPVGALALRADEVQPLPDASASLWPLRGLQGGSEAAQASRLQLDELLERLSARLGSDRVSRPVLHADHRPEAMQAWEPAVSFRPPRGRAETGTGSPAMPQPAWMLPEPLPLASRHDQPLRFGPLQLLAGPQRIENGWWREFDPAAHNSPSAPTLRVQRDYYVAYNPRAGLLWIFAERPAVRPDANASAAAGSWFLHGVFG